MCLPSPTSPLVCLLLRTGFNPLPALAADAVVEFCNLLDTGPGVCVGVDVLDDELELFFKRSFVPARLNLVIRVPAAVLGKRLPFALDAVVEDVADVADDGVLLLHDGPVLVSMRLGTGGRISPTPLRLTPPIPPSEFPLKPLSLVLSPDPPSRLTGRPNWPGVKLPLTPKPARLDELPMCSRRTVESKTSVLRLSK